jgi:hypothetical protein
MKISRKFAWLAMLALFSLVLAGCAATSLKPEQPALLGAALLKSTHTIGQTFTAHYDGLNGINVYLNPLEAGDGQILLHLRAGPAATDDLRTASLPVSQVDHPGDYTFNFPVLEDSNRKDYYLQYEIIGNGAAEAGVANGAPYLFGALYQNSEPTDAQLTFALQYRTMSQLSGLVMEGLNWILWLCAGIFLFVLPGWAMLDYLWQAWSKFTFWERLALATGVSLSIYPILFLWTDLAGLHLGVLYAWLPPLIGLAALVWKHRPSNANLSPGRRPRLAQLFSPLPENFWPGMAMLVVVGLLIGTRLWAIRRIDLPLWGDSYQHTMIAQLLVDHRGLFETWSPYATLTSLNYHFGFHTIIAVFHWITGLTLPQATLVTGQLLNVLAVIVLYPLATRLGGSQWAGVVAALVAGLASPMPMYYLNWGRYTQLTGQVILPAVILLAWALLETDQKDWLLTILCWITLGGLALTHVRVLVFSLAFIAAFILVNVRRFGLRRIVARTFWLGIGGLILSLPWLVHLYGGEYMRIFSHQLTTPASQMTNFNQQYNAIGSLSTYLPTLIWILLLLAIAWGLLRRERDALVVTLWWGLLLLTANPQWLRLPGAGALTSFAVFIAAYIPAGILIGAAAGWTIHDLPGGKLSLQFSSVSLQRFNRVVSALLVGMVVFASAVFARSQLHLVDPTQFSLATRPDMRAFQWIEENTPQQAGFLVNSFFAYGGSLIAGSDGGWWIPLLTQRNSTQPPLNYGVEHGPIPDYRVWINKLPWRMLNQGLDSPETITILKERNIDYIYIGQQQGKVGTTEPLLDLGILQNDPNFEQVYHQDRVWIFKVK